MYDLLLFVHIVGACVLLGTGAGIAFFMVIANRTRNPKLIAHTARTVVLADSIFTATAVVVQPLTGYGLARLAGWSLTEGWIVLAFALYGITGLFWLPVLWIQAQMRRLADIAHTSGTELPERYHRLYRVWFAFGFPAFAAVLAIIWLMVIKPELSF